MIDRLSDASAQMTFTEVARGKAVTKSELNSDDGVCTPRPSPLRLTNSSKFENFYFVAQAAQAHDASNFFLLLYERSAKRDIHDLPAKRD